MFIHILNSIATEHLKHPCLRLAVGTHTWNPGAWVDETGV